MKEQEKTRAGFAAIVGRPNVGKSTLLNKLLGEKIAIVSQRPQTTRNRILGVMEAGETQMVLLDTPGIHKGKSGMSRFMVREALDGLDGVDCVVIVAEVTRTVSAAGRPSWGELRSEAEGGAASQPVATAEAADLLHRDDTYVLEQVRSRSAEIPLVVAVNKIDLLRDRRGLLPMIDAWRQAGISRIVPLSALKGEGVDRLVGEIDALMPPGPHLYPSQMVTDRAERFIVAELVREQVFRQVHKEVPFSTAVEIESFEERPERHDVLISAVIHVERSGQKAILVGHRGQRIKQIGIGAREQIGRLLGCTVHLALTVRLSQAWTQSRAGRQRFGYG